jgi:hypothetical protein
MAAQNHGKEVADKVGAIRDWLLEFLAAHPVFVKHPISHYSEIVRGGIGVQLLLQKGTYASAYHIWDDEKKSITSTITMVESGLGQSTGFFLFHLQLLLAVLAGASEITLDNDTDDPARARQGIYQLFETNDRTMNEEERSWMTEENWLKKPEMVHLVTPGSLERIQNVLLERVSTEAKAKGKGRIRLWRAGAVDVVELLFREAQGHLGGKRRSPRGPRAPKGAKGLKTRSQRRAHRAKSSRTRSKQSRRRSSSRR